MILTLNWLQKYLPDFKINDLENFRNRVDTRLTEVEAIEEKGLGLTELYVAEIVDSVEHPSNDKLKVCKIILEDKEEYQVVCGAPNAVKGLKTIYCMPGGQVFKPGTNELITIQEKEIGGVESKGMLCSAAELGLSTTHDKLMELATETPLGLPVSQLLKDVIIEIQNKSIPHRPDCFSHLGIARELSAIFTIPIADDAEKQDEQFESKQQAEERLPLKVSIKDEASCHRFTAVVIKDVKVQPSPLWLQIQLIYSGIRPINNIVDATNYVMLDVGQPMHAFDYKLVKDAHLIVRKATRNEKLTTLDGIERELTSEMTVVADPSGAKAVAGIMGGLHSEISNNTQNIILEAANWEMYQIRRTSRDLGLRSEASTRYEKGFSPSIARAALHKAANLIIDLAGGEIGSEVVDIYPNPQTNKIIKFNPKLVKQLIGIELDKDEIIKLLASLNLEVVNKNQIPADAINREELHVELEIKAPLYRMDLNQPEDIIEEIARLYGYENIKISLPQKSVAPTSVNDKQAVIRSLKHTMTKVGFNEIFTYPMIGQNLCESAEIDPKTLIGIKNAISPELDYVRDSITPSLLSKINTNLASGYDEFGLFEVDRVALKNVLQEDKLPLQPYKLAALFVANDQAEALGYIHRAIKALSYELKAEVQIKQNDTKVTQNFKYLHPAQSGTLLVNNEVIGVIGFTHTRINEAFDAKGKAVCIMELHELDKLIDALLARETVTPFHDIQDHTTIIRDISFWVEDTNVSIGEILTHIKAMDIDELQHVDLIDVFDNKKENKMSVTLRVFLQGTDKTLESNEINALVDRIKNSVESNFNLKFRG